MPKGRASNAVGSGPPLIPIDWNSHVIRITHIVPKAMVSPWAKLENRRMPKTSVNPNAPKANWLP